MLRFPCRLTFCATLLALLAACMSESASAPSPTTSTVPSAQQAAASPSPLLVNLTDSAPGSQQALRVRPVDPATLADQPGFASLDFGHHYVRAVSPDGRTMAVIIWPSGANSGGVLHLIDLASWTDRATGVRFDDSVAGLLFSPDGRALYWSGGTRHDAAHGIPADFVLYRYDIASGDRRTVATFPASFTPGYLSTAARFTRSGARLALYGVPTDSNNLAEGAPHLMIVDLIGGGIATDLRLDGVKAGQFRESQAGGSNPFYALFSPGLAWDPARERLYIAHADGDAITVVDLAGGTIIAQQEIRPRTSLAGRVVGWLMPHVAAKGGPSTDRWAVLSNDGARLFVIGQHAEPTQQPDGQWRESMTPTGLQVIETRDLREVAHLDVPANAMMLSPDGRRLILPTDRDDGSGAASGGGTRHQLTVVDAERLIELDQVAVGGALSLYGFSADGRYAYLSDAASGGGTQSRTIVRVFDLERRLFVAERALDGPFADLLTSSNDSAH